MKENTLPAAQALVLHAVDARQSSRLHVDHVENAASRLSRRGLVSGDSLEIEEWQYEQS